MPLPWFTRAAPKTCSEPAMSSPDIETWRVAASGSAGTNADDGLEIDDVPGGLVDARADWPAFIEQHALPKVLSSKTKERTNFINEQISALARNPGKSSFIGTVTLTYRHQRYRIQRLSTYFKCLPQPILDTSTKRLVKL